MTFYNLSYFSTLKFSNMIMNSANIESKLSQPQCALEDLLEEDEIIQEMKNQNQSLISYFKKDKIKNLVDYIIKEPTQDEQKVGYKFPFVANELLNCSDNAILDYFLNTNEEIQKAIDAKTASMTNAPSNVIASGTSIQFDSSTNIPNKSENADENHQDTAIESGDSPSPSDGKHKTEAVSEAKEEKKDEVSVNQEQPSIAEENTALGIDTKDKVDEPNPDHIELLDYLLSFVETEQELNYVLVGYFVKFTCLLLLKKPMKIIKYIYLKRPEILKHLVNHCYRKGISDLLSKLILFENSYSEREKESSEMTGTAGTIQYETEYEALSPLRANFIITLFDNIDLISDNREKITNLFGLLTQLTENKAILSEIIDNELIVSKLFALLQSDTNQPDTLLIVRHNYSEVLSFFITVIKAILLHGIKLPSYEVNDELVEQGNSSQEVSHTVLSKALFTKGFDALFNNYSSSTNKSDTKELNSTFNMKFTPLGLHRVKIIELIANLFPYLKNISSAFDLALCKDKSNFFPNTFDYLIQFELNNSFQLSFSLLFKNYLNDANHHLGLSKYLFENFKLLDFIQKHLTPDNKFSFASGRKIFRGYNAILISLSYKINTIGGGSKVAIPNKSREGSISFVNQTNINDIIKVQSPISISSSNNSLNPRKSHSTNIIVCEFLSNFLEESWNAFFTANVAGMIKKFEKKLCEVHTADCDLGKSQEEVTEEAKKGCNDSNNPFASKDDNFFNDDNDLNDQKDFFDVGNEVDMNDFEFTDEVKGKDVKEEDFNKEAGHTNMKVDELDDSNYNGVSYWKDIKSANHSQELNEALKELNLSK